ncbi:MAG: hypothetical protein DMG61_14000 [Acidobacteria bacterium]|nr:MAG: hypothetical protein DMG71_13255 [Acidobacteriota bacterium]PYY13234.1 MAG: hypothetical protein DMG61_14000 [Acidobacteriota bacterium]
MAFGTELPVLVMLGFVVLGPKRLHTVLRHVARAKAEFQNASGAVRSQLTAELENVPQAGENRDEAQRAGKTFDGEPEARSGISPRAKRSLSRTPGHNPVL